MSSLTVALLSYTYSYGSGVILLLVLLTQLCQGWIIHHHRHDTPTRRSSSLAASASFSQVEEALVKLAAEGEKTDARIAKTDARIAKLADEIAAQSEKMAAQIAAQSGKTYEMIANLTAQTDRAEKVYNDYISNQADQQEEMVNEIAQAAIMARTQNACFDIIEEGPQLSRKMYGKDGRLLLEWDGLLYSRYLHTLFCVEAKSKVRVKDVEALAERLDIMRAYFDSMMTMAGEKEEERQDGRFRKQAVEMSEYLKLLGKGDQPRPKIAGILGFPTSKKGSIARKAKKLGIYILLKDSGTLVAPDDVLQ